MKSRKTKKVKMVRILGETVRRGSKRHGILLSERRHFLRRQRDPNSSYYGVPISDLLKSNRRRTKRCWKGYSPVKGKRPYSKGSCRRIKRNSSKMNFPMDSSGDSAIGELEIQRKDGEYDIWTIIKRGRLFVIGTPTNTGLLSEYYYKMEPGETVQNALQEVNADLEVLATDGESYMSRVKKVPKNKKIPANALRGLRRNPTGLGNLTHNFLSLIDMRTRQAILKNIADHYGISMEQAYREITDEDAEHLLDYVTGPTRYAVQALMKRYRM